HQDEINYDVAKAREKEVRHDVMSHVYAYGQQCPSAFVDHNHLQIDGNIEKVLSPEPLADKWRAFGWHVIGIDGHDLAAIRAAIDEAKTVQGKPTMIVAETVKGKGVSFMENQASWHGSAPNAEQAAQALRELGEG
ncbi:MAG: transketolase, partial [Firmicutes bacterium]|nr:transketolase [Bacillota bacterium]